MPENHPGLARWGYRAAVNRFCSKLHVMGDDADNLTPFRAKGAAMKLCGDPSVRSLLVGLVFFTGAASAWSQSVEVTPTASAVTASTHDGNVPGNVVDNSLASRW